ncbi:Ketosteroid isomerase homolog [Novosphingobium sp. CF614]|uniref:nuclear transport factor 2 family protein n=1 Tax=Novosphingobium sp. CF614 TaxID=1884364 RepID=UPI0008E04A2B|nr:nuclear transport factor 2 family protein [Novosphingobium sp. CF614]SFG01183.1 Ketosteroid isomerase homolog [Novosphingobium sp. CF614]
MNATQVADHIAIRECIDRFSLAMSMGDADAILPLFMQDGSWGAGEPFNFEIAGAARIVGAIAGNKAVFEYVVQMIHSVSIDVDGDAASARCLLEEVTRKADGQGGLHMYGFYKDDLVRTDEGWRFAKRHFTAISFERCTPGPRGVVAVESAEQ